MVSWIPTGLAACRNVELEMERNKQGQQASRISSSVVPNFTRNGDMLDDGLDLGLVLSCLLVWGKGMFTIQLGSRHWQQQHEEILCLPGIFAEQCQKDSRCSRRACALQSEAFVAVALFGGGLQGGVFGELGDGGSLF